MLNLKKIFLKQMIAVFKCEKDWVLSGCFFFFFWLGLNSVIFRTNGNYYIGTTIRKSSALGRLASLLRIVQDSSCVSLFLLGHLLLQVFATVFEGASLTSSANNYCTVPHPWLLLGLSASFQMKCIWIRSLLLV